MSLVEQYTPKEFVLKTMNIYILQHSKKYNLTTWNAYMKLTEQKAFKSLMRKWFDNEEKLRTFLKKPEKIRGCSAQEAKQVEDILQKFEFLRVSDS